jgi:peptidoglycan-associated lipoprotein
MYRRMRSSVVVLSVISLALLLSGCPKRPMIPQVAAPPPAAPAPQPAAPPAPTPTPAPAPLPPAATPTPPPAPTPPPDDYKANAALKPVYFAFDSMKIRPGDAKTLDASADWLKANPDQVVLIAGNCDERGTNEYNLALGERRAKSAMGYLTSKGIDASRITLVSYGKERPVCTEHNEACWSQNRRDDFLTKRK